MADPIRLTKTKSDTNLYEVHFAAVNQAWLRSGEVIASAQVIDASSGLGIASVTNATTFVAFYVGSGATKGVYTIEVAIYTTPQKRTAVRSFELEIVAYKYTVLS